MFKRFVAMVGLMGFVAAVGCGGSGSGGTGGEGGGSGESTGSSSSVSFECCINGAHFTCPSKTAFDKCGDFGNPDPSDCNPDAKPCGSKDPLCPALRRTPR